ncbi:mediator complex subunit MED14-domain-containing protein [Xylariaceae sp. FL0016]|nr:mediator complex subunit MED14-domain-containing protein [Xylariaceae sp. FL0016]
MPGVAMMENGIRDSLPTNHDRSNGQLANGTSSFASQPSSDHLNGPVSGPSHENAMVNGNGTPAKADTAPPGPSRMNDLPDEIQHITQGYIPLGGLLSRLAQQTHNQLSDEIMALAKMPGPLPAVNGHSSHLEGLDDASAENLNKKVRLLNFVQEKHGDWVKALVITNWSRKAAPVSKLIDLSQHINTQRYLYDQSLDYMINIKRDLTYARLPNPDLRTALHTLSRGDAPWMPDAGFIKPPSFMPEQRSEWLENADTLLSLRLNLEDHENMPEQFKNYRIGSGCVTFKVAGEFEVDLFIRDDDFEKQFMFSAFRFDFTPSPPDLAEELKFRMKRKVNELLRAEGQEVNEFLPLDDQIGRHAADGLHKCYRFLHDFVLTHKINEYLIQAFDLSNGRWVDSLKVERLHRAMSIQYWCGRAAPNGPKNWIILGVHSGQKTGAPPSRKASSHLFLRWFMDNREVKDVEIPVESSTVSTEALLSSVIGRHVAHILTAIYSKIKEQGRFKKREASLQLETSQDQPVKSLLRAQMGPDYHLEYKIAPISGEVTMTPQSTMVFKGEKSLNMVKSTPKDPIQEGIACLSGIRNHYAIDEMVSRGHSMHWEVRKPLVSVDVKSMLGIREQCSLMWLRRRDWPEPWYIVQTLSMSADRWWLMKVSSSPTGAKISKYHEINLTSGMPDLSDDFFKKLEIIGAGMISHLTDIEALRERKIKHYLCKSADLSLPSHIQIPSMFIKLSDVIGKHSEKASLWAHDYIQVRFRGTKSGLFSPTSELNDTVPKSPLRTVSEARIQVSDRERFTFLKGNVDKNIAYDPRLGLFAFSLDPEVGSSMVDQLTSNATAIGRIEECLDAVRRSDRDVQSEVATVGKVVISYSDQHGAKRWKATLDLSQGPPKLSLELHNPQLRALDVFNLLLSSDLNFKKLPFYLSSTLPIHQALDSVEDSWQTLQMNNQGRAEIFSRALDWFNIRYSLSGANKNAERRLNLQIKLRERHGDTKWHVFREEPDVVTRPDDDFKKALSKVWNADNRVWQALGEGAAVSTDHCVRQLIRALDDAIRPLATLSPAMLKLNQAKAPTPKMAQHKNAAASKVRASQPPGNVVVLDD